MCRSIKTLRTDPEYVSDDVRAAALQYVRKLSGFRAPSKKNEDVFNHAIAEVAEATQRLLDGIGAPAHDHPHDHHGHTHSHEHAHSHN